MKKFTAVLFILIAFATSFANADTRKVKEYVTPAGIKAWGIEDNYLPIISVKIIFTKSGFIYDPENKQGLSNMASSLLVEGAGGITGVEYMKKIEEMAANISFGVDDDNAYVTLTCLKENLDESMRLLVMALTSPDFTPDAIDRVRKSILTSIAKEDESPESRAMKAFRQNYFAGHPYSRRGEGTVDGLNAITRQDLVDYAKNRLARQNMLIGVVGNVNEKEIGALFDKYLTKLPKEASVVKDVPEFTPGANLGKVIRIEQDVPQSVVVFGMPGPKRLDADFYPTYLMNYIIGGGGFESRLMDEVREKRGLAYTIYTSVQTYKKTGLISGYVGTKNASVDDSIKLIREEFQKMHDKGITDKELSDAKDYLIGSFPLRMTQNSALAEFLSAMQDDNLGIDFLDKRNGYIKAVQTSQVNAAAAKYLDVSKMLVVVVGKSKP